jgi:hypothetical protein
MVGRRSWGRRSLIATRSAVIVAASALVVGVTGFVVWYQTTDGGLPDSTPECSWPVRVVGPASPEQAGLVRCYLKAVAQRDLAALTALAIPGPGLTVSAAQLGHWQDARRGTATAVFVPNPVDSAYVNVTITYADGQQESFSVELANPQSANSWRIAIGSYHGPGPGTPPPPAGP